MRRNKTRDVARLISGNPRGLDRRPAYVTTVDVLDAIMAGIVQMSEETSAHPVLLEVASDVFAMVREAMANTSTGLGVTTTGDVRLYGIPVQVLGPCWGRTGDRCECPRPFNTACSEEGFVGTVFRVWGQGTVLR